MRSFFADHHPLPPKPALSEHSTSNPTSSTDHIATVMYTVADPPATGLTHLDMDEDEEEEEDDDEDEDDEAESGSEDENQHMMPDIAAAEPSELMQIEMPEEIRIGSPNDGSNNLDSNFHLLAVSRQGNPSMQVDSYRSESTRRWGPIEDPVGNSLRVQLPSSGKPVVN